MSIVMPPAPALNQWLTRVAAGLAITWPARIAISSCSAPIRSTRMGEALDPGPPEPDGGGAGEPAELGRMPRPEHEVRDPVRSRDERVLHLIRAVDDAVARPHLVDLLVLPSQPGAFEHVIDL